MSPCVRESVSVRERESTSPCVSESVRGRESTSPCVRESVSPLCERDLMSPFVRESPTLCVRESVSACMRVCV